ncbi:MAG: DUF488 domain-containing protein [Chloroflexi bacterium]|nr:DUF488 domain-containing protein [Chloroflexota bacterium]
MKPEPRTTATVFTIGHATRTLDELIHLLKEHGVSRVVDVRTVPRSRHNPQFNGDTLPETLKAAGIEYLHASGLGGLRHPHANSVNTAWRNASFRGFADYMQTPEFEENLQKVIEMASRERIALMCAETVPWRCHRSLIADALSLRGIEVEHILSEKSTRPHSLTPWAKVDGLSLTYPAESLETQA